MNSILAQITISRLVVNDQVTTTNTNQTISPLHIITKSSYFYKPLYFKEFNKETDNGNNNYNIRLVLLAVGYAGGVPFTVPF